MYTVCPVRRVFVPPGDIVDVGSTRPEISIVKVHFSCSSIVELCGILILGEAPPACHSSLCITDIFL